jgi:hypothetical protein
VFKVIVGECGLCGARVLDGERKFEGEGGAFAGAFAGGGDVASVLTGDGADEEEAEAGAFDFDLVVGGGAVEAFEDVFEFARGKAEAGVGDGEEHEGVALDGEPAANVDAVGGVFDGVVEEVEDSGAEVFGVGEDEEADAAGDVGEGDGVGLEVVAGEHGGDAVGDEGMELDALALMDAGALAEFAGFEDLLDGGEEAVGVGPHDGVEALTLGFVSGVALEGIEIEADGGDGGFELVGDGVEEGVLALVTADFTKEEDGVEDDAGDEDREEKNAEEVDSKATAIVMDPGDVEDDGKDGKAHAERDEERFRSTPTGEVHKRESRESRVESKER